MRNGLLLTLVLPVALAYGDTPAPPAAFWDYLAEFGDDTGQVFDPLDLTDAEQLVRQQARTTGTDTNATPSSQEDTQP